jgi:hypothetical protein
MPCQTTSAAHSRLSAVQPVRTWCQYSQNQLPLTRKLMIATSRSAYADQATANQPKYALR